MLRWYMPAKDLLTVIRSFAINGKWRIGEGLLAKSRYWNSQWSQQKSVWWSGITRSCRAYRMRTLAGTVLGDVDENQRRCIDSRERVWREQYSRNRGQHLKSKTSGFTGFRALGLGTPQVWDNEPWALDKGGVFVGHGSRDTSILLTAHASLFSPVIEIRHLWESTSMYILLSNNHQSYVTCIVFHLECWLVASYESPTRDDTPRDCILVGWGEPCSHPTP